MSRPHLQDFGWHAFRRAETYQSHSTIKMRLTNDRGPVLMYECYCGAYRYSYNSHDPAPECAGGLPWSFSTTTKYD